MYVSEVEHKIIAEDAVLLTRWASGEQSQTQASFEYNAIPSVVADACVASAKIRKHPMYTRIVTVRKKRCSSKKKDIRN